MVEEYAQYGITCKGDGVIDQGALRIADEDVILEGEATQCSVEMDRKSVSQLFHVSVHFVHFPFPPCRYLKWILISHWS